MNAITRCPDCRGTKKLVGLGFIERDCEKCAGKGHVPVEKVKAEIIEALKEEAKHERETEVKTVAETKRKYVRKAKETPYDGVCDVA